MMSFYLILSAIYFFPRQHADAWMLHPSKHPHPSRSACLKHAVNGNLITAVQTEEPILRTLYDPPPKIDFNHNNKSLHSDDNVRFVTQVTNGRLDTEEGSPHVLYYEVHHRIPVIDGKVHINSDGTTKRGLTGLVLHGGPGAGCFPRHANFFSPELYESVVLLDQRGCGRSTPLGEVSHNTLPLLVQDVERLRLKLLDDRPWDCILGGSWGCTLALAYAHTYPSKVRAMVLRGLCLFRPQEIDWCFGDPPPKDIALSTTSNLKDLVTGNTKNVATRKPVTASQVFSDGWQEFCQVDLPDKSNNNAQPSSHDRRKVLTQYYHRLLGSNPLTRAKAAQSWFRYEMGIYSKGYPEKNRSNHTNTRLLVWNPSSQQWHYESAKVYNNQSIDAVNPIDGSYDVVVDDGAVQSLRRFSDPPDEKRMQALRARIEATYSVLLEPLPIEDVSADTEDSNSTVTDRQASNATFDPSKFIPAQAMLTCYYSTNDDYVLQDYRQFLSVSYQNTSWYNSLPPCIAIQGSLDAICPVDTALDLHHVWKELELRIAFGSGHSMYDLVISGEIVKALDRFGYAMIKHQNQQSKSVGYNCQLKDEFVEI
ncbi:hypothetical protein ACHAWO_007744 [Cyclotella atomus]|uniref:prolyl aminopeptidase n=1 Tax=Cyclotella atomus TaxID=382360 RepID=A0ABD3N4A8_9STRA